MAVFPSEDLVIQNLLHRRFSPSLRVCIVVSGPAGFYTAEKKTCNCSFFGNVTLGSSVTLPELLKLYDVVVLACGAGSDRVLDLTSWYLRRGVNPGELMPARTGQFEDLGCGIVLKSIGYKSIPVNGLPFDNQRSVVPNVRGQLISEASGDHTRLEKGFYVCGWLKRGPTGIIATNLYCAEETFCGIVHYLKVTKIRCIFVADI